MKIHVKNILAETILGVYEQERKAKQKVYITVDIEYDAGNAGLSDKVQDTLDYHPVISEIQEIISQNSYELLERMVYVIGDYLLSIEQIKSANVKIDKPEAPIENIDLVSVSEFFSK